MHPVTNCNPCFSIKLLAAMTMMTFFCNDNDNGNDFSSKLLAAMTMTLVVTVKRNSNEFLSQ